MINKTLSGVKRLLMAIAIVRRIIVVSLDLILGDMKLCVDRLIGSAYALIKL